MRTTPCCMLMVSSITNGLDQANKSFAIALVTGQLSKEIREVGQEIEKLFGVLDEELLRLQ